MKNLKYKIDFWKLNRIFPIKRRYLRYTDNMHKYSICLKKLVLMQFYKYMFLANFCQSIKSYTKVVYVIIKSCLLLICITYISYLRFQMDLKTIFSLQYFNSWYILLSFIFKCLVWVWLVTNSCFILQRVRLTFAQPIFLICCISYIKTSKY